MLRLLPALRDVDLNENDVRDVRAGGKDSVLEPSFRAHVV